MQPSIWKDCLVAFGSNLGDSQQLLGKVRLLLERNAAITKIVVGNPVVTAAIGGPKLQRDYLNTCIRFESTASSAELMVFLSQIESDLGRIRQQRWESRTVDLDLLICGADVIESADDSIIVPHPRMSFRRFVLEPANEIAAGLIHPVSGLTVGQLLNHLNQSEKRIGLVTSSSSSVLRYLGVLKRKSESLGHTFHHFVQITEAHDTVQKMKLVGFFDFDASNVVRAARGFAGPTLRLKAADPDEIENEFTAAIEATLPI